MHIEMYHAQCMKRIWKLHCEFTDGKINWCTGWHYSSTFIRFFSFKLSRYKKTAYAFLFVLFFISALFDILLWALLLSVINPRHSYWTFVGSETYPTSASMLKQRRLSTFINFVSTLTFRWKWKFSWRMFIDVVSTLKWGYLFSVRKWLL